MATRQRGATQNTTSTTSPSSSIFSDLPEAPVFHPTLEEFQNPIEFIKSIREKVAPFGICRIVPPAEWDRNSFRRNIDPSRFRFPTKVQNVHQFLHRSGASEKFIKKLKKFFVRSQTPGFQSLPKVDGVDVDLLKLHQLVEERGGIKQMDTNLWREVAVLLHICPDAPHALANLSRHYTRILLPYVEHLATKDQKAKEATEAPRSPMRTRSKRALQTAEYNSSSSSSSDLEQCTRQEVKLRPRSRARNMAPSSGSQRLTRAQLRRQSQEVICIESDDEEEVPKTQEEASNSDDDVIMVGMTSPGASYPPFESKAVSSFTISLKPFGEIISDTQPPPPKRRKLSEDGVSWREVRLNSFNGGEKAKFDDAFCTVCKLGDRSDLLLICDSSNCFRGTHADCLDPPLDHIPKGKWFCDRCTTRLEREKQAQAENRELSEDENDESVDEFGYGSGKVYSLNEYRRMALDFERRWMDPAHALDASDSLDEVEDSSCELLDDDNTRNASPLNRESNENDDEGTTSGYNRPTVAEIEKEYWRLVNSGSEHCSVVYGSDLDVGTYGSGFPVDLSAPASNPELARWRRQAAETRQRSSEFMIKCGWNLNNLPYVSGLQFLNESAGGVTRPMIYVGMLFSSFCWHTEDNFLYSINYVHTGAAKRWYGVPASAAQAVENAFQGEVPHLLKLQPNLLYLLVTQIPPDLMAKKYGVPVCTTLQREGEFVITFPRAYHAGFNTGFNMAESVNFAAPDWLGWGRLAIEEYRNKRSTVFALEELLTKAAAAYKQINDVDFAKAVRDELRKSLDVDLEIINALEKEIELTHGGDLRWEFLGKTAHAGDYPQCEVCGFDCYLWNCICDCSKDTPKCLKHVKGACECPVSNTTIVARYSVDQLLNLLNRIDSRARELEVFTPIRTRSSRGPPQSGATARAIKV